MRLLYLGLDAASNYGTLPPKMAVAAETLSWSWDVARFGTWWLCDDLISNQSGVIDVDCHFYRRLFNDFCLVKKYCIAHIKLRVFVKCIYFLFIFDKIFQFDKKCLSKV